MMESIVGNISSSRRLSRTGWVILNRAQEEIQALPRFHSPPHSWFNAGPREEVHDAVATFLQELLSDIELATHFYSQAPAADADDGELAERVLWALVLMQSERLPGTHLRCLLCAESAEMDIDEPRMQEHTPRVSMERRLVSTRGYWTLNEISIHPCSRDEDYRVPLCWIHEPEFNLALQAVLGFVGRSSSATHLD